MSNKPWPDKQVILKETGHLKLNMALLQMPEWNSGAIKDRTEQIISKIKELYKYRESTMQQKRWNIKLKPTAENLVVEAILFEDGMVTILPNSQCLDSSESKIEAHTELFNDLLEESIIELAESGKAKFVKEYSFSSISAAAGFLLDGSRNGWEYFLTEDGESLDKLRSQYFSKNI